MNMNFPTVPKPEQHLNKAQEYVKMKMIKLQKMRRPNTRSIVYSPNGRLMGSLDRVSLNQ